MLFYDVVDDFEANRMPFGPDHFRYAQQAHARGELFLAGALGDPANSAIVGFQAAGRTTAESFARQDPDVVNGLVLQWKVHPSAEVIGGSASEKEPLQGGYPCWTREGVRFLC